MTFLECLLNNNSYVTKSNLWQNDSPAIGDRKTIRAELCSLFSHTARVIGWNVAHQRTDTDDDLRILQSWSKEAIDYLLALRF
jgi:hypothetical protein